MEKSFQFKQQVLPEWVDYNGHMNDAEYARVFSEATDAFMAYIGLNQQTITKLGYTIFTLETHICYLKEAHDGEQLTIESQLLDVDEKRIHQFFTMKNVEGEQVATMEQMLMGIDQSSGRPGPFPKPIETIIQLIYQAEMKFDSPKQAGRQIGIQRKK
ncbi:thioesterase family protein [Virgibacillus flavescens]|uniref:thioesterase family protein n=1 Tax=Virgibacillus flavescens TaxID=1611422 RepID=UPI003D331627